MLQLRALGKLREVFESGQPCTAFGIKTVSFDVTFSPEMVGSASRVTKVDHNAANGTTQVSAPGLTCRRPPRAGSGFAGGGCSATAVLNMSSELELWKCVAGSDEHPSPYIDERRDRESGSLGSNDWRRGLHHSGVSHKVELGAGQSASLNVSFAPPSSGSLSGESTRSDQPGRQVRRVHR
jgi:hypothetical protein